MVNSGGMDISVAAESLWQVAVNVWSEPTLGLLVIVSIVMLLDQ